MNEGTRGVGVTVAAVAFAAALVGVARADRPARERVARADAPARPPAAGFRMEGDPEIAPVFGDSMEFRRHVTRFFQVESEMSDVRGAFSQHLRDSLNTLVPFGRTCPTEAVAPIYAAAQRSGRRFRELGAELESLHEVIVALDEFGETAALTPDDRWRVRRADAIYRESLRDYREMRSMFDQQVGAELAIRRCRLDLLLTMGDLALAARERQAAASTTASGAGGSASPPSIIDALVRAVEPTSPAPLPAIAAATFFVDNRTCDGRLSVYVDGVLLGEIAGRARAAFQAEPGRHAMCLIPTSSDAACGDPGTLRSVYVHDGWAMMLRCD